MSEAVTLPLSNGGSTVVDADVAERLAGCRVWGFRGGGGRRYAALNGRRFGMKRTIGLHRFIMWDPTDRQVDHIDGDPLNNRRSNLRVVTPSQNVRNPTNKRRGKYGPFVSFWKNRYYVRIRKDGKLIHISPHRSVEEAQTMADILAERLLGWPPGSVAPRVLKQARGRSSASALAIQSRKK